MAKIRDVHHERNHHRKAGAFERKKEVLEVLTCNSCGVIYDLGPANDGGFCSVGCADFEMKWHRWEED